MSSAFKNHFRGFVETLAKFVSGEPATIITRRELDRLERLAYRRTLEQAEARGDTEFIESEIRRNQLDEDGRRRVELRHTPLEQWPDTDPDIMDSASIAGTDLSDPSASGSSRSPA